MKEDTQHSQPGSSPSNKKHAKRDNRHDGADLMNVAVFPGVLEGTHVPYVGVALGGPPSTMSIDDARQMGMAMVSSSTVAFCEACFIGFVRLKGIVGTDLEAYQAMLGFRAFREHVVKQQQAANEEAQMSEYKHAIMQAVQDALAAQQQAAQDGVIEEEGEGNADTAQPA
jgi:hypothetical protein